MNIKDLVKDTFAEFTFYRDGELWYRVGHQESACTDFNGCKGFFSFPVPISDTGSGTFPASIKAITLMRWIRKQLEREKEWEVEKDKIADSQRP